MLRPLTHNDVERMFDRLADEAVDAALRERLIKQGEANQRGILVSSMYVQMVEESSRNILRKAVSNSMQLLTDIVAKKDLPYDQIKGPALSRVTNIAHRLANLVGEANQKMPRTLDMNRIRAEYEQIVEHGISDFEVGMIDGKPAKPSQNATFHVGGDLTGNVLIAGDGARQVINQTRVEQGADLLALADELAKLRAALIHHVADAEQAIAIGRIAEAEVAAKGHDGEKAGASLAAIGKGAGKWMLGTAKEIGTKLLIEYLEKKYGV